MVLSSQEVLTEYLLQDGHVLGSGGVEVKVCRPWPWGLPAVWLSGGRVVGHCRAVALVLCWGLHRGCRPHS